MDRSLNKVIRSITDQFGDKIGKGSRFYTEVDIGKRALEMGFEKLAGEYRGIGAVVPLKGPVPGMKVRIDGRTFVRYAQFESGVAVAEHVARRSGLSHRPFAAQDSMILNFT